jgi:cytochrome P450
VPEIIRWQSPVIHMRRTALEDAEIGAKRVKMGDKVVIWHISANRDEEAIESPNSFIIDRPREHMSFGLHPPLPRQPARNAIGHPVEEILKRDQRSKY